MNTTMRRVSLGAACWLGLAAGGSFAAGSIAPNDPNIQYMGHWDLKPDAATTNNSGSSMLFGFTGRTLSAQFRASTLAAQHQSQFYVSIDGGAPVLYVRDNTAVVNLTPTPLADGPHTVELVVKDVDEHNNRWNPPLLSQIAFLGFVLDDGASATRGTSKWLRWSAPPLKLEFLGDSITQGVRALSITAEPAGNDGTRDYAYLVSLAFDARTSQVGFGSQGITRGGGGNVPAAGDAFGLNFQGSPEDPAFVPDAVVINQGTNDGGASSATFAPLYTLFLQKIRAKYPAAWIFAMRPFNGAHAADIANSVASLADPRMRYVDTTGWLSLTAADFTDGNLHPNEVGHAKAAVRLIPLIANTVEGIAPAVVTARMLPSVLDLRTGIAGVVTVVLTVPSGYTVVDVRGNGARAQAGAATADGTTYVATFLKSDLTNVPAAAAVDFNLTGTLRSAGTTVPFATTTSVRILK